jgi:hypothetical protein
MSNVLEGGEILFFYRPRVGVEEVRSLADVQRFFFVIQPDGTERHRTFLVGRKRLPETREHERTWAFVAEVADRPDELRDDVERKVYETKTRGVRVQPEARPAGEGRYAIAGHDGHTHLAYVLELPREPGRAQETFRIKPEASYIVAVRNPQAPAPPGVGLRPRQRPELPPELLRRFGGKRFAPVDPPRLLDFRGVEIVLIGAAEDASEELGIDLDPDDEQLETADIFQKLRIPPGELPTEPLDRGELR